jgi:hypothetical protein
VPKLIARLRERSSVGRLALEALIRTAARFGEIRVATWSEVDLDTGMWSVPAERMKMGRVHHVPLAPQAIEAFRRAEGLRVPCSDLVFPGQKLSPASDMTLLKVMRDMETGVTVHGFRSAFRDWVAEEPATRAKWRKPPSRTRSRTRSRRPTAAPTSSKNAAPSCASGRPSARAWWISLQADSRSTSRRKLAILTNVAVPILTVSTSPGLISSYSFDRPIPVKRRASGMRTVRGSS